VNHHLMGLRRRPGLLAFHRVVMAALFLLALAGAQLVLATPRGEGARGETPSGPAVRVSSGYFSYESVNLTQSPEPEKLGGAEAGKAVWQVGEGSSAEIVLYDFCSGQATRLTDDDRKDEDPVISDRFVVWRAELFPPTGSAGPLYGIKVHDLASAAEPPVIFLGQGGEVGGLVGETLLAVRLGQQAWNRSLSLIDLPSGETQNITANADPAPNRDAFDGRYVAYAESQTVHRIYDSANQTIRTLVSVPWPDGPVPSVRLLPRSLADGRLLAVAQTSFVDENPELGYVLYDLASGEIVSLPAVPSAAEQVLLSRDHLVWRSPGAGEELIGLLDLHSGSVTELEAQPGARLLALEESALLWLAPRPDDPGMQDLYLYQVAGARSFRLNHQEVSATNGVLDGERVIWEGSRRGAPLNTDIYVWRAVTVPPTPTTVAPTTTTTTATTTTTTTCPPPSTTTTTATPAPVFWDVSFSHPYATAVNAMAAAGIIGGYEVPGGREFRPQNSAWRAQFAKMIVGAVNLPVAESDSLAPFTDLDGDEPANLYPHEYVAAAYRAGITRGKTASTFAPWDDISRAQVITMVVRAAKNLRPGVLQTPPTGWNGQIGRFDSTHGDNLVWAEYNGLLDGLQGYGASWDPWHKMTRGEVAQMLYNLCRLNPGRLSGLSR
jgi:hypothetical protein